MCGWMISHTAHHTTFSRAQHTSYFILHLSYFIFHTSSFILHTSPHRAEFLERRKWKINRKPSFAERNSAFGSRKIINYYSLMKNDYLLIDCDVLIFFILHTSYFLARLNVVCWAVWELIQAHTGIINNL